MSKHIILHLISSLRRGGRERQLATLYRYSDPEKMTTRIVCFNRSENSYVEEYRMEKDVIYLQSGSFIKRYFELRKIVKEEKAGLVWSWGGLESTFGILLLATTRVRHINGSIRHGIVLNRISQRWRMLMLHLSRNIVANSQAGLRANKLKRGQVMYNGLDDQFFKKPQISRDEIRQSLNIGKDQVCLVSVANLVPYKDYPTILQALSQVDQAGIDFRYLIVGDGPERDRIANLTGKLGLEAKVTLLGRRTDVKDILFAADVFVHSSRGEGCSNAILEAMAAGLPVIASDTGGTSELVDESTGRLFPFKDAVLLSKQLAELTGSLKLRLSLGQAAANKARKQFSSVRMMQEYFSIICNVLEP